MKQTDDLQVLKEFVIRLRDSDAKGETLINQENLNPEEPILSDEDTAGRQALQILRIIVKANDDSMYFEYVFNEPTELEELNVQLEEVYSQFPKRVIDVDKMNDLVSEL